MSRINRTFRSIKNAFQNKIERVFNRVVADFKEDIKSIINDAIVESDTARSLIGGQLRIDFGLTSSEATHAVSRIGKTVSDNISIRILRVENNGAGNRLIIEVLPTAITDLVSDSSLSYISKGGHLIPWVQWLLTEGSRVILDDYEVVSTAGYDSRSRSGGGFMLKTGQPFRVDPKHAGTPQDNFITRAMQSKRKRILDRFQHHVRRNLK